MANSTPRFSVSTVTSLAETLRARRATLSDCVETLRAEATEAYLRRDISDLLDNQDPSGDSDAETVLELARRAEVLRREVDDALRRVARGTYGYCTSCGEGIALLRLRALPATEWCIGCSSLESSRRRPLLQGLR